MKKLLYILILFTSNCVMAQTYNDISFSEWSSQLKQIEMDGEHLAYYDEGNGTAILMLHGVPTSSWLYRHIAPILIEKGFRVIIPDMMGYGRSSMPDSEAMINLAGQAKCLDMLYKALDLSEFYLTVHDAGGVWAWQWLSEYQPKIKGLVLLNTILYLEGFNPPMTPKKEGFMHRTLRWAYKTAWIGKTIVKSTLKQGVKDKKLSKKDKKGYTMPIEKGAGSAIASFFGDLNDLDAVTTAGQDYLKNNETPICAIWGEKDPFLIGQKQLPLAMENLNLSNLQTHILYGYGHFIQEEAPDDISRLISEFIKPPNE